MIPTLRLYCELIPPRELLHASWTAFFQSFRQGLASHGWEGKIEVVLKVDLPEASQSVSSGLIELLQQRDALAVDRIWLRGQLQGAVYMNTLTWRSVMEGWQRLLQGLEEEGLRPEGLFFDLEPELEVVSDLAQARGRALWRLWRRYAGRHHEGAARGAAGAIQEIQNWPMERRSWRLVSPRRCWVGVLGTPSAGWGPFLSIKMERRLGPS